MKKINFLLTASLLFSCITQAQQGLLWRIQGSDLKEPSYIFGTMHLIDSASFFWPKGIHQALDQASTLVTEVLVEDLNGSDPVKALNMIKKMLMPNDTTLKLLLSTEDYAVLEQKMIAKGLPIAAFEKMKPMFVSMSLDFSRQGNQSYEKELEALAKQRNLTFDALQTFDFQLSMFDFLSLSEQATMLSASLKSEQDSISSKQMLAQLTKTYLSQDLEALNALMQVQYPGVDVEKFNRLFVTDRNQNWIPIMQQKMRTGCIFFAVGAGHLGGELGVLALLKKQGYQVSRVEE